MPEGPEVKTVARTIAERLIGKELGTFWHSNYQLRRPVDYSRIKQFENHIVDDVSCYGKILFISVNKIPALMVQLGMTGQLIVVDQSVPLALHTHIRWTLKNSTQELRYIDPRRFGLFDACNNNDQQAILHRLGPDPFCMKSDDHAKLSAMFQKSTRAIKEILLDQSVIVGVGNIYASEALYRARINPLRRGVELTTDECMNLIKAISEILELAYRNCGTTFSNYIDGTGKMGAHLSYLKVFQRHDAPCMLCTNPILRITQGGRSTFFCSTCQI